MIRIVQDGADRGVDAAGNADLHRGNADRDADHETSLQAELRGDPVVMSIDHRVIENVETGKQIADVVALLEELHTRRIETEREIDLGAQRGLDMYQDCNRRIGGKDIWDVNFEIVFGVQ